MTTVSPRCGAVRNQEGSIEWRVWAPHAKRVQLLLPEAGEARIDMSAQERGYFSFIGSLKNESGTYAYLLDDAKRRPDPCSLWQPSGASGDSHLFDPLMFPWTDPAWRGIERDNLAFYELHVGTFTPEGTFDAVIPRLPQLRDLGITAIELMPVGQFSGTRNWGYDGVLPYAAQHSYGGPQGLQNLVNAAHAAGLGVFLDVVYNHMGPEHNYFDDFGPYFTDRYKTPWGRAVNFDGPGSDEVRAYFLNNARMWLDEFHLDGLRLDAVHAIYDFGTRHILAEIEKVAREVAACSLRKVHVVAESDLNDPRIVLPPEKGGHGINAQWSDDFHHTLHVLLTGEKRGYYADFRGAAQLGQVMEDPFLIAGTYSASRGRTHGAPAREISGDHFVVSLQNHDQIGNRAKGDRLATLVESQAKLRLGASLLLFSPYLPLLFMGEEYGEKQPFPFFCSFEGAQLIENVRQGRRREFADFSADPDEIPDPQAETTFAAAKLSWSWPEGSGNAKLRELYKDLLRLRKTWKALMNFETRAARFVAEENGAILELIRGGKSRGESGAVEIYFNLGAQPRSLPGNAPKKMLFSSESQTYGGTRTNLGSVDSLAPFECAAYHF